MLVALIPGSWRRFYARPLVVGTTLMPLLAIAVIPLLVGLALIYPWTDPDVTAGYAAFKGAWLSTGFFVVRAIVYMLVLIGLAWALLAAAPRLRGPIAAGGRDHLCAGRLADRDRLRGIDRAGTSTRRSTACSR